MGGGRGESVESKAKQSHSDTSNQQPETILAVPALTSQWYSLLSGESGHGHSPSESVPLGKWVMPTFQCTVYSLQSAELVCGASSPRTKEAWQTWLYSRLTCEMVLGWAFLRCVCCYVEAEKSRNWEDSITELQLYLLGETLVICFMRKHWIANYFPVDGKKRCLSSGKWQRVTEPLPFTILFYIITQDLREPWNFLLLRFSAVPLKNESISVGVNLRLK